MPGNDGSITEAQILRARDPTRCDRRRDRGRLHLPPTFRRNHGCRARAARGLAAHRRTLAAADTEHHLERRVLTDRAGETYTYTVPLRRGALYSLAVGFLSSFLGIGGGVIHVPLLVRALGFPTHIVSREEARAVPLPGPLRSLLLPG